MQECRLQAHVLGGMAAASIDWKCARRLRVDGGRAPGLSCRHTTIVRVVTIERMAARMGGMEACMGLLKVPATLTAQNLQVAAPHRATSRRACMILGPATQKRVIHSWHA